MSFVHNHITTEYAAYCFHKLICNCNALKSVVVPIVRNSTFNIVVERSCLLFYPFYQMMFFDFFRLVHVVQHFLRSVKHFTLNNEVMMFQSDDKLSLDIRKQTIWFIFIVICVSESILIAYVFDILNHIIIIVMI